MKHKEQMKRPEKSRCPVKRAAASFFGRVKNGVSDNLLLEKHYFRLDLADTPFTLVVTGIGRKKHGEGVGA